MRVLYHFRGGSIVPTTTGTEYVARCHLEYFARQLWSVDCVLVGPNMNYPDKDLRKEFPNIRNVFIQRHPDFGDYAGMVQRYRQAVRDHRLARVLREPRDLFFTNHSFTFPLLSALPPGIKKIVETQDLATDMLDLFRQELTALGDKPGACDLPAAPSPVTKALRDHMNASEVQVLRLFDTAIALSWDDYHRMISAGNVYYIPPAFPIPPESDAAREAKYDLLYIGSNNPFNISGITWFYNQVFVPYLAAHGVRLGIAGRVCSCLGFDHPLVTRIGVYRDALTTLYAAAKLVILPVFVGTGVAIKTIEALANGKACVMTPLAGRGIRGIESASASIDMGKAPEATARIVLALLEDGARRSALGTQARQLVRDEFAQDVYDRRMNEVIDALFARRRKVPVARVA